MCAWERVGGGGGGGLQLGGGVRGVARSQQCVSPTSSGGERHAFAGLVLVVPKLKGRPRVRRPLFLVLPLSVWVPRFVLGRASEFPV